MPHASNQYVPLCEIIGMWLSYWAAIASSDTASCSAPEAPPMPLVTVDGLPIERPITETHTIDGGRTVHMRQLHDELQLTYVHGLLSTDEIVSLVRLADARGGFIRSPVKQQGGDALKAADGHRNSSSCPMLWPLVYGSEALRDRLREQRPAYVEELELVERITGRVAALFSAAGMEMSAWQIEPLQLVRYRDAAFFGPHHDYHAVGADGALGSSVQGEQRAFTLLLFGTSSKAGEGGETHFPLLRTKVSPSAGDAVAWANVDANGEPNPRSLHEGLPPAPGHEKVAINCWIADREFASEGLAGAYRTTAQ